MKVDYEQCMEYEVHKFVTEASTLGMSPMMKFWPKRVRTSMGNGQDFLLERCEGGVKACYRQALGCISLTIFND